MNIRCIAIDDEPLAVKKIAGYIQKVPFLELVAECRSASEAMGIMDTTDIQLLFIDINMPDISGMEFVKSLTNKPCVVFTTAYSEYAVEGFQVDAIDYLLKPITFSNFLKAANKVKNLIELTANNQKESFKTTTNHLFVKSEYKIVRIELSDIKYIESMHEYIRIHLFNEKPIISHVSLKSMEEQLPSSSFLRVHRSFIVNGNRIKLVERNRIVFDNNVYIPVSDPYKANFQKFLSSNSVF